MGKAATAKTAPVAAAPIAAALVAEPERAIYDGKPLDVKSAEDFFVAISTVEMQQLAESESTDEQLPARMLLELAGDKDLSWANTVKSLKDSANFKREVLEMEGAAYLTRKSIERLEALGQLQPKVLEGKHPAAFGIAVYMEACVWAAKEKLGMNVAPMLASPMPNEQPPEWPIM